MPEAMLLRVQPGTRIDTPLSRLAQRCAELSGWRRYGLALLLGVLLAGAMPPVDISPLIFIAFPGLLWLDDGSRRARASFALGYAFALGFFVAGMYWIAAALFVDIADFWWALPFAVLGLPAVLALLPAAAMGMLGLATKRWRIAGAARVCLFAVLWSAAEWVRGHALTGLPWNLVGYAWSGGFPGSIALLQTTAVTGIYGLSLLTTLAGALPALLSARRLLPGSPLRTLGPVIAAAILLLVPAAGGALRLALAPTELTGTWLRLVQPSIAESSKWNPVVSEDNFHRLIDLSTAPAHHPLAAVLWPEAASTYFLGRDSVHRQAVASVAPKGGYVITGALRAEPPSGPPERIFNSIEAVDAAGNIRVIYDKSHLVPFGEYMPLRSVLPFQKLTPGRIDLSPGPGPRTLSLPGLSPFGAIVCYEAIFPGAVVDEAHRPDWIFNATNDAWYGRSSGPYQHFAIARTRAVEEGLPLVRDANNGISGVVDPEGRVLARTALNAVGYADIQLPAPGPRTPYSRAGDWIFLGMLLVTLIPVLWRRAPR